MNHMTTEQIRWTIADVDLLTADEWKRYEIIDGELFVTRAPHSKHQITIGRICRALQNWSDEAGNGEAIPTPGVIFSEADSVIPDVVWISRDRLTLDQAQARINSQMEITKKTIQATVVLDNSSTPEALYHQVDRYVAQRARASGRG